MAVQREQVVQTAEKYVSRGKIEPAIREYRKLLADNPNDINTLNRIGDLYARIQRIDEAVDFFTQIAEQYSTEGFFVKAIAIYKKIIKLDPTRLEVYEKLAELYHRQGLVNEARTQYQVLADYYQKHDNAASAIAIYQKMADLEPSNPSYHVKLAEIYQSQQLTEKAMNEYRVIAEMMITHGRPQDAAQVYERALDIDSSNMGFINDAVFRLKESGNTAAAARFLAIAAERNPQATRIGRLARVIEEPEPAPPPPPPAPVPVAAPRPVPPPAPPVEEEIEIPYGSSLMDQAWEEEVVVEEEEDLTASIEAAAASMMPVAPIAPMLEEDFPSAAPVQPVQPVEDAEEEAEIELDLDEAFVLDMDADDEPASLVKPPPDMLSGTGSRLGSAWTREEEKPAPPKAASPAPRVEDEVELEIDLGEIGEEPGPAPRPEPVGLGDLPSDGEILLELEEPDLPQLSQVDAWAVETDLDLPPLEAGPLALEPAAAEAPAGIDADMLERTAAELQPQRAHARDEDLVSEAEVLAKYGLEDKALERLREALRLRPHSLGAYSAMIQIHLEKGRHERVVELAGAMARAARETRDDAQVWPKTRRQLVEAGYRFDGDRVVADPHSLVQEPAPAPAPPPVEAARPAPPPPVEPPPAPAARASEPPAAAAPAPAVPEPAAPAPARRKPAGDIDQMLRGLLDPKPKRPAAAAPPARPAAPPPAPAAPEPPAAMPPEPPAAGPVMFNPLEIGEMIESEDFDWEPAAGAAPASSFAPPPPSSQGAAAGPPLQSLDDTGLSWLDEAERNRTAPSAGSESLFDEEDDFFDLAAELEQELSQEDLFPAGEMVAQQEQSLEEIVEGFKKGVAEHLSPTDYDTHFNLGIAYREMGLLDEAIGEFQVAAKDPGHLVLCCSMLGLCFLDKGLPELAVKWYRRGLETPDLVEEDHLGLLYDLGCAYLTLDDKASAYKAFVDLYGINNAYRDVVARIEELGR